MKNPKQVKIWKGSELLFNAILDDACVKSFGIFCIVQDGNENILFQTNDGNEKYTVLCIPTVVVSENDTPKPF